MTVILMTAGILAAQSDFTCGGNVNDVEGNVYGTVKIGSLCWMTSNMRTKTYNDGREVPAAMIYESEFYPDNSSNYDNFGFLYTWYSAVGLPEDEAGEPERGADGFVQGICPEGWHIPTYAEMNTLKNHRTEDVRSTELWLQPNDNTNNSGFSALPGGLFNSDISRFEKLYGNCYFWTDSAPSDKTVMTCQIPHNCDMVRLMECKKNNAYSIRCVLLLDCPEVSMTSIEGVKIEDATDLDVKANAQVHAGGAYSNLSSGFVYSRVKGNLDLSVEGTFGDNGEFSASLQGLSCTDTVYVCPWVKNSGCERVYGDTMSFVVGVPEGDGKPCPDLASVRDYEGNVYATVKIGSQCWTREYLKSTKYADGSAIPASETFNPDNNAANVGTYGLLYTWSAVMNGSPSSTRVPSGVQGICPDGWHLPSEQEIRALVRYAQGLCACHLCNNIKGQEAKAFASNDLWETSTRACVPGNDLATNNQTGFSMLPSGRVERELPPHAVDNYEFLNKVGTIWSATQLQRNTLQAFRMDLHWDLQIVGLGYSNKVDAYSVRCVRD